jgi:hypothetical protein
MGIGSVNRSQNDESKQQMELTSEIATGTLTDPKALRAQEKLRGTLPLLLGTAGETDSTPVPV